MHGIKVEELGRATGHTPTRVYYSSMFRQKGTNKTVSRSETYMIFVVALALCGRKMCEMLAPFYNKLLFFLSDFLLFFGCGEQNFSWKRKGGEIR